MSAAKDRGTRFETAIVQYLRARGFTSVERRALSGRQDRGDIAGVPGVVIEAKSVARTDLAGWLQEAQTEKANDGATVGAVWFKRRGTTDPGQCYVLLTGEDFTTLLDPPSTTPLTGDTTKGARP